MKEEYNPLLLWHMYLHRMANPLRNRNKLTPVDVAVCVEKARKHIARRELLKQYEAKLKHARQTLL